MRYLLKRWHFYWHNYHYRKFIALVIKHKGENFPPEADIHAQKAGWHQLRAHTL